MSGPTSTGVLDREFTMTPGEPPGGGPHALAVAVRYEWARLRTLRSTWFLLGAAVAVNAAVASAVGAEIDSGDRKLDPAGVVTLLTGGAGTAPRSLTALVLGIVGVLVIGQDFRHGTLPSTLCVSPRRGTVLAAKALVVSVWAAGAAVLAAGAAYLVGLAVLGDAWRPSLLGDGATPRALGGFVALVVLTALVGLALGGVLRGVPAALAVLLLVPLALEPLAEAGLDSGGGEAARFMPFTAAHRMIAVSAQDGGHAFVPLGPGAGGLVFAGYAAVLLLLAGIMLKARDAG